MKSFITLTPVCTRCVETSKLTLKLDWSEDFIYLYSMNQMLGPETHS